MTLSQISHHLLLCTAASKALCCDSALGLASWLTLKQLIRELGLENPNRPEGIVLRSKVDCLRICRQGPILLIWPDGCWYEQVTPEKLAVILNEHVVGGNPCEQWIIRWTPLSSTLIASG